MSNESKQTIVKRIRLVADIAIIVTAVLLCVVLVKNYLIPKSAPTIRNVASNSQIQSGKKISLPGIDWAQNGQTLLLALSTTCHFCSESAPFYQRLVKEVEGNTHIVVVLPETVSDGKSYLNKLGVSLNDVMQVQFDSLGVQGTPTLILVDNNGNVMNSWVGKLSNTEEAKVISKLHQSVAQR